MKKKIIFAIALLIFAIILATFFCFKIIDENNVPNNLQNITAIVLDNNIDDLQDNLHKNLNELDTNALQEWLNSQKININGNTEIKEILKNVLNGEYKGDFNEFMQILGKSLTNVLLDCLPSLLTIICVAILYSLLQSLTSGFEVSTTKEVVFFVCYSAIIVLVLFKIAQLLDLTLSNLRIMKSLMDAVFPLLLTFMTLLGGVNSSVVYQPMMGVLTNGIMSIIFNFILPLFTVLLVFCVVANLSKNLKLHKLASFFKNIIKVALGGIFSLFITFLTFQGLTSSIADGISIKTAKFAVQSYVPIVGGYLSDGFDLMLASVVLIKNSVGYVSLLILLITLSIPILQLIVFSLGLKLASGVIEPICDERFSKMLYDLSKNLEILVAIIAGTAFLFIVTVMLVMFSFNLGAL